MATFTTPEALMAEVEQLRVQLAGCGVAALGGTHESQVAKQGQYGWSPAYEDVLTLRRNYEALLGYLGHPDGLPEEVRTLLHWPA